MKGILYTLTFVSIVSFMPTNDAITQSTDSVTEAQISISDTSEVYPDTVLINTVNTQLANVTNTLAVSNYELKKSNSTKQTKINHKLEILRSLETSLDSLNKND